MALTYFGSLPLSAVLPLFNVALAEFVRMLAESEEEDARSLSSQRIDDQAIEAFGLGAADGVMQWLLARKRGTVAVVETPEQVLGLDPRGVTAAGVCAPGPFVTDADGLLALAAGVANHAVPFLAVLSLPILFAAGMSLMDTADGAFMSQAYGWAFSNPDRKSVV